MERSLRGCPSAGCSVVPERSRRGANDGGGRGKLASAGLFVSAWTCRRTGCSYAWSRPMAAGRSRRRSPPSRTPSCGRLQRRLGGPRRGSSCSGSRWAAWPAGCGARRRLGACPPCACRPVDADEQDRPRRRARECRADARGLVPRGGARVAGEPGAHAGPMPRTRSAGCSRSVAPAPIAAGAPCFDAGCARRWRGGWPMAIVVAILRPHEQLCVEQDGIERRIRHEAASDAATRRPRRSPAWAS